MKKLLVRYTYYRYGMCIVYCTLNIVQVNIEQVTHKYLVQLVKALDLMDYKKNVHQYGNVTKKPNLLFKV